MATHPETQSLRNAEGDFSDYPDMFLNINTPHDRDTLEQRMAGQHPC